MYDRPALRGSEVVIDHWTSPHSDEHCRLEQCGRQYVLPGTSSCQFTLFCRKSVNVVSSAGLRAGLAAAGRRDCNFNGVTPETEETPDD
jgi:hypothetical protein